MNGKIKRVIADKGFGFIANPALEKDLFFHRNSVVGSDFSELAEGDEVSFEVEDSPKGKNAVNVKKV